MPAKKKRVLKKPRESKAYVVSAKLWVRQSPPIYAFSMKEAKERFAKKTHMQKKDIRVKRLK